MFSLMSCNQMYIFLPQEFRLKQNSGKKCHPSKLIASRIMESLVYIFSLKRYT